MWVVVVGKEPLWGEPPSWGSPEVWGKGRARGSRAWSSAYVQVATWLREKNSVALEEDWRDPALLRAQLWKQHSLQAELDATVHHQQRLQMVRPWEPWDRPAGQSMGRPRRALARALNQSHGWRTFIEYFL